MHKILETYRYYADKRYSTVAGTLVYFFLMSIAPFVLWLTLVFGNVDVEAILTHELFESISPFLRYLKHSAQSAASGAGIILLATSLYSSTNFFYHLRRSGEIIYEADSVKGGLKLRLASLLLIAAAVILVAAAAGISVTGTKLLSYIFPEFVAQIIISLFFTGLAFLVALVLNLFACPYKLKLSYAIPGSLLTTALWLVFLVGFGIYMRFSSPEKLYGKIASVIIFLLWCYVMMNCFVIGMINNKRALDKPRLLLNKSLKKTF